MALFNKSLSKVSFGWFHRNYTIKKIWNLNKGYINLYSPPISVGGGKRGAENRSCQSNVVELSRVISEDHWEWHPSHDESTIVV